MSDMDDWEAELENWDSKAAEVPAADAGETKGERLLRAAEEPDMSRFADEEEGGEEEVKYVVPQSKV